MHELLTIYDYMRSYSQLLGERILDEYAALHSFHDQVSPRLKQLLRTPFAAQQIAIMGVVKRWQAARTALIVAECGTGKTSAPPCTQMGTRSFLDHTGHTSLSGRWSAEWRRAEPAAWHQ